MSLMLLICAIKNGATVPCKEHLSSEPELLNALEPETQDPLLQLAIRHEHLEIIRILLDHGAYVNQPHPATQMTALQLAINKKKQAIVKLLLQPQYKANVNLPGNYHHTPLHEAARLGDEYITHLLLEKGAKVSINTKGHQERTPPLNRWVFVHQH